MARLGECPLECFGVGRLRAGQDVQPEDLLDAEMLRLDLSPDETSRQRQKVALERARTARADRLAELRRVLLAAVVVVGAAFLAMAIPFAGLPDELRDAAVPGAAIAQAYSGRGLERSDRNWCNGRDS